MTQTSTTDPLRDALNKIADLGSCAGGRTPGKLIQHAIDIAVAAVTAPMDADIMTYRLSPGIARLVGELAREAYDRSDPADLRGFSPDVWTDVESVITGLENNPFPKRDGE